MSHDNWSVCRNLHMILIGREILIAVIVGNYQEMG